MPTFFFFKQNYNKFASHFYNKTNGPATTKLKCTQSCILQVYNVDPPLQLPGGGGGGRAGRRGRRDPQQHSARSQSSENMIRQESNPGRRTVHRLIYSPDACYMYVDRGPVPDVVFCSCASLSLNVTPVCMHPLPHTFSLMQELEVCSSFSPNYCSFLPPFPGAFVCCFFYCSSANMFCFFLTLLRKLFLCHK